MKVVILAGGFGSVGEIMDKFDLLSRKNSGLKIMLSQ